ncbi:hypothetical protein AVEN_208030-1 [Araneus ventricosus]|uniref:Uncharacterized protein n=1 Tax=Araneus ventricosus TaxID=182803 RepID=A0A4Y2F409_ARAVE|nr:hypothetical protein AVEN_208030-1 [Araneus ventricosus]
MSRQIIALTAMKFAQLRNGGSNMSAVPEHKILICEAIPGGEFEGTNNWVWWLPEEPPRSPDLTQWTFLWGYLKQQVYATSNIAGPSTTTLWMLLPT